MINDFIAGSVAGSSSIFFTYPLDTLKTRIQTVSFSVLHAMNSGGDGQLVGHNANVQPNGAFASLRTILREESFFSLYKGMAAPLVAAGFLNSLLFAGYTGTLRLMHDEWDAESGSADFSSVERRRGENSSLVRVLLASSVGAALQLGPAIPIEMVKTKLQVQRDRLGLSTRIGPLQCARQIVLRNGFAGLYQGGSVMLLRDMIGYLFYIPVYELLREALSERTTMNEHICVLFAGGVAGAFSWWSICPLELVKNRVQAQSLGSPADASPFCVAAKIWRNALAQGGRLGAVTSFYRGATLLALRSFPSNAIAFFAYEQTVRHLNA